MTDGESLVPDIPSSLVATTSATRSWNLQLDEAVYEVHADIPAGTLTLFMDNEDAIKEMKSEELRMKNDVYDLSGRKWRVVNGGRSKGIIVSKGKKVLR